MLNPKAHLPGRLAALPMYDLPGLRAANDALWRALAVRLADAGVAGVPPDLTRNIPLDALWRAPHLLLAQSCGYPLMTSLKDTVKVVATPRYRAPGCEGAFYRSAIVVAANQPATSLAALRGCLCVTNEPASNSGMNMLRAAIAPLAAGQRFFRKVLWSGSHRTSLAMLVNGEADVAAIDCVTFELVCRTEPVLTAGVKVLAWSAASPGLPLISAAATDDRTVEVLRAALADVAADHATAATLDTLLIDGFDTLTSDTYNSILDVECRAHTLGYPELS